MNKQKLIKGLKLTRYSYDNEDEFGSGVRTGISIAINEITKLYETEKVVIPKFAAEWIEKAKEIGYPLAHAINRKSGELGKWLHTYDLTVDIRKNQELFAEAWVNGYEVEEEQKYYVDLDTAAYVAKWNGDNQVGIYTDGVFGNDEFEFHLTEQEIKNYDERFWPFAVEVAE